ncbi:MAG: hypothetical protein JXA68_06090 [Ignavibacteriales bacterium]|nr:hypothetical protein [Ignavibacteriales bacterium]
MEIEKSGLTFKKILKFWYPLAATWIMMSLEGPLLTALIARMLDPKFNLAAFGVAFSFAMIVEAPVIMIMSATTTLAKNYFSFLKLKKFIYSINIVVTLFMIVLLIPQVFDFIAYKLISLPKEVAELTYRGILLMLPWPGAIGYRRFYQGLLIRNHLTRRVAYGTMVRITSMATSAFIMFNLKLDGIIVGCGALSIGVTIEAIATRMMANKVIKRLRNESQVDTQNLTYKQITIFYYPLALMSFLALGINPIVTFFLGKSYMALESLAVLPVVNALVFIFRAIGLSYQEVVIALIGEEHENYKVLKNLALAASGILTFVLGVIALTPLSDLWFLHISGLSSQLAHFAILPLIIMIIYPAVTLLVAWQRAVLVHSSKTIHLTVATLTEVTVMFLILLIGIKYLSWIGVIAAALAFVLGRGASNLYLIFPLRKVEK